jgi:hypothetical protein
MEREEDRRMNLEELGPDPHGNISSQPLIKSGKNRGFHRMEKGGTWICAGGFCYESPQDSKSPHYSWSKTVQQFGIRVGVWDYDGVREFYLFMSDVDPVQSSAQG